MLVEEFLDAESVFGRDDSDAGAGVLQCSQYGPRMLLNRNLLYTAVTRARKCVTVVGSEETFREMIRNEKQQQRYSSLDRRICETEE